MEFLFARIREGDWVVYVESGDLNVSLYRGTFAVCRNWAKSHGFRLRYAEPTGKWIGGGGGDQQAGDQQAGDQQAGRK